MAMYNNGFPIGYNPSGLYNPQSSPYTQQAMAQQQSPSTGIIWVQGEAGAKSYLLAPNTTLPLWDSENQVIYIKSTDQNGMPLPFKIIDYTIREQSPTQNQLQSQSYPDLTEYIKKTEFTDYMKNFLDQLKEVFIHGEQIIPAGTGTTKSNDEPISDVHSKPNTISDES